MGQGSFAAFLCGLIKIENDFLFSSGSEQPNAQVLKVGSGAPRVVLCTTAGNTTMMITLIASTSCVVTECATSFVH